MSGSEAGGRGGLTGAFKWCLKWALRLLLVAVVLLVIFILSLDSILRAVMESRIHSQTGMSADIGKFHFGPFDHVIEIKDLQLYNSPKFGGTPFLNIPEIHVEYDAAALKRGEVHITLLRFNLGELDIVRNQDGETNILSLGADELPDKNSASSEDASLAELKKKYNVEFTGIDCLNLSVGTFKYLDLQNQTNNLEQKIGLDNIVITNVTSKADLVGLGLLIGLRSGDFFKPFVEPDGAGTDQSAPDVLKMLGH
jgi:hypothetical protein